MSRVISPTRFWMYLFLNTLCALGGWLPTQACADELLPPGDWMCIQPKAGDLTVEERTIPNSPVPTRRALLLTVARAIDPFYSLSIGKNFPQALEEGTRLRLRFWARSATNAPLRAVLERNGPPYESVAEISPNLTPEWKEFVISGTTPAFAANGMALRFQAGHRAGTLELAGISVQRLGVDRSLEAARKAIEPTAVQERIRKFRMADLKIEVRDEQGRPVVGAEVAVTQTKHAFLFGCNLFLLQPDNAEPWQQTYRQRFTELFNFATLPFYWGAYEPERGKPQHSRLMAMAQWCKAKGILTKGHPLIWHEVYPGWGPKEAEPTIALLRDRVRDLIPRFQEWISVWDVVNEANVSAGTETGVGAWARRDGADELVQSALHWAREANREPKATLLYNDFKIGDENVALLEKLRAANALPDAIGIQSHMHDGVWSLPKVWQTAERFAKFQLPIHFTELTVLSGTFTRGLGNSGSGVSTPEGERAQADYLEQFYTLLFSHPQVEAITYWDFSDRDAWMRAPAGFLRQDMTPKPVFDRLNRLINGIWRTKVQGSTDNSGRFQTRAFYGEYRVVVKDSQGRVVAQEVVLPKSSRALRVTLTLE